MKLTLELDRQADAAYVRFARGPSVKQRELDEQRIADYDQHGEIIGIEFLTVSRGVDLRELPRRPELEKLFEDHHIPQYA